MVTEARSEIRSQRHGQRDTVTETQPERTTAGTRLQGDTVTEQSKQDF